MGPRFFVSLLGCTGLFLASSCGGTSSSSPESAGSSGAGVAGGGAGRASGGSDSAGRGGAGGGSAGTVFVDPCKGVPPPQYACVPAEQAWEWIRNPGAGAPLPDPSAGGEGGAGNVGAGGDAAEGGAKGIGFPAGTCPSIQAIGDHLGPGANTTGFGLGAFRDGECCYNWGVACG